LWLTSNPSFQFLLTIGAATASPLVAAGTNLNGNNAAAGFSATPISAAIPRSSNTPALDSTIPQEKIGLGCRCSQPCELFQQAGSVPKNTQANDQGQMWLIFPESEQVVKPPQESNSQVRQTLTKNSSASGKAPAATPTAGKNAKSVSANGKQKGVTGGRPAGKNLCCGCCGCCCPCCCCHCCHCCPCCCCHCCPCCCCKCCCCKCCCCKCCCCPCCCCCHDCCGCCGGGGGGY
ncbi:hypothetical protein DL89DRAFT_264664, partial [Linderina pennispora]